MSLVTLVALCAMALGVAIPVAVTPLKRRHGRLEARLADGPTLSTVARIPLAASKG